MAGGSVWGKGLCLLFSPVHRLIGYFLDTTRLGEYEERRDQVIAQKSADCVSIWYLLRFCTLPGKGLKWIFSIYMLISISLGFMLGFSRPFAITWMRPLLRPVPSP